MLEKFRERRNEEDGFTLVELLVVMLILGILAAIAIPAFFSQRDKGYDSDAKSNARTAQTALESYAVDNGGKYTGADMTKLAAIEGTITNLSDTVALSPTPGDSTYTIVSTSKSGTTFSIDRASTGAVTFPCSVANKGGCGASNWGG